MPHFVRNFLTSSTTLNDVDCDILQHVTDCFDNCSGRDTDYDTFYARYKGQVITLMYQPEYIPPEPEKKNR